MACQWYSTPWWNHSRSCSCHCLVLVSTFPLSLCRPLAVAAVRHRTARAATSTPVGISHHGGPVMSSPITVYVYWVGSFTAVQKGILRSFVASLNPSSDATNTGGFTLLEEYCLSPIAVYVCWVGSFTRPVSEYSLWRLTGAVSEYSLWGFTAARRTSYAALWPQCTPLQMAQKWVG